MKYLKIETAIKKGKGGFQFHLEFWKIESPTDQPWQMDTGNV